MNEVTIGEVGLDRIEEILAIETRCYPRPWSERMFRNEYANELGIQRGAYRDGRLIGYAFGWVIFEDLHVNNVAVNPDVQQKGLGKRLMDALFAEAQSRGAERVSLEVRPSNVGARALYASLGFREVAVRKGYYSDTGEDAIVLFRSIVRPPTGDVVSPANL